MQLPVGFGLKIYSPFLTTYIHPRLERICSTAGLRKASRPQFWYSPKKRTGLANFRKKKYINWARHVLKKA